MFDKFFFQPLSEIVWQIFFLPYTWCMELYDKQFRCMKVNPKKFDIGDTWSIDFWKIFFNSYC